MCSSRQVTNHYFLLELRSWIFFIWCYIIILIDITVNYGLLYWLQSSIPSLCRMIMYPYVTIFSLYISCVASLQVHKFKNIDFCFINSNSTEKIFGQFYYPHPDLDCITLNYPPDTLQDTFPATNLLKNKYEGVNNYTYLSMLS